MGWTRDSGAGVVQLQATAAGGSPMSASSQSNGNTDVHALVQKAIRRGYSRSQRGRCLFSAGCAPATAPPRPALPRSSSMPTLTVAAASPSAQRTPHSALGVCLPHSNAFAAGAPHPPHLLLPPGQLAGSMPRSDGSPAASPPSLQLPLPPSTLGVSPPQSEGSAVTLPVAAAPPQALKAVRTAGMLRCWSAADLTAAGGAEMSPAGHPMHARAAAQEQLQEMTEVHLLNTSAAAEDLQQLAKEAAMA